MNQGNTFKEFYKETFSDIFEAYNDKIKIIGKKMFVNTGSGIILSFEFTGPNQLSLVNITLTAATKYGVIDLTEIPLSRVFYKYKFENREKTVLIKKLNSEEEKFITWNLPLTDDDKLTLNELVSDYIEIFLQVD